ncbi:CTP--phosphocholine cytidylyltransferase [Clostridiaceae bacterium 14S0207]|nr:CTP--phosphocholine cytidylyltransferase [Clostridiaceae bacterium 14S0207]
MRAIILAAGKGTRLRPLTNEIPKPLVKVVDKPIIETQIEYLLNVGIKDIIVVSGYKGEKLLYLEKKFKIKVIHNPHYNEFNNIYSMYLARRYLENSYVLDGDVYIDKNVFTKDISKSTYFGIYKSCFNNEWVINSDENLKVNSISIESTKNKYILSGISYWNREDGKFIKKELEKYVRNKERKDLYWDDIVRINIQKLNVYLKPLSEYSCYEIDNIKDLNKIHSILKNRRL